MGIITLAEWSNRREASHGNVSIFSVCGRYCISRPNGLAVERENKYRLLLLAGNSWRCLGKFDDAKQAMVALSD